MLTNILDGWLGGRVAGWVAGWVALEEWKLSLTSAKVEVEVEAELGNTTHSSQMLHVFYGVLSHHFHPALHLSLPRSPQAEQET